jgi:preprotein translocase subunit YajC
MIHTTLLALLAQAPQGAPSLDVNPAAPAATAAPAAGGAATGAAPAADAGGSPTSMLVMMFAIVGVFIVFSIFGSRRERKKRELMLGAIKKHDKVLTLGGIVGSVVEFKDDTVVLKVDEQTNTRITVTKTAISQVLAGAPAQ